ncbi:MAG: NAD-dependent epimerase/dehydratase family protein [Bacteroidales bacterium]
MILVTGSNGLVGSHIVSELLGRGESVKALIRNPKAINQLRRTLAFYHEYPDALLEKISFAEGDVNDIPSLEKAFEGVDAVCHCAAIVSFHPSDKKSLLKVNTEGTANVVNLALYNKVNRFCHISSIAVLGERPGSTITEDPLFDILPKGTWYARSKFLAEREVWRGIEEGLPAIILNPSVILGPGDWAKGSSQLFSLIHKGLKFYADGVTGYVDVRDVAKAAVIALMSNVSGERFILNGENLSFRDLFFTMADAMSIHKPYIRITRPIAELVWRLAWLGEKISGKPSPITHETARSAFQHYRYSAEKFKKQFDFQFTPIHETIAFTASLFLKENSRNQIKSIP